ncbi:hypothetical protein VIOR3934_20335 [Vibrio orientalis CIP 102891 = ATCC 33934]|uniref:Uncharacterized protein n=1 Tax=Vibrio orientalis CIP 102891 = ATCC 33934 TaxID=675816 RepID=C9QE59_VIBOR|nr:hypothetical protein VIA_001402 [Vibrio orientalis CIP 102891 = ATCC 33934]EGU54212.1 hypothetical protein VIOR3934_20335 [Vibrio orientalis CIP 102891 = ATCC 33934]
MRATKKCDLTQDKYFDFGLEKLIQNQINENANNYAVGSFDKHFRHRQVLLLGKDEVSLFSIEKHQQVSLP